MITDRTLIACGVGSSQALEFAPHLAAACERFGIRSIAHQAAFIAEAIHESAGFTQLEESLYYKTPERIHQVFRRLRGVSLADLARGYIRNPQALANLAYANVNGNGDEASGDGWRYRARGVFGLTGQANYMAAGAAANRPYKEHPELVARPLDAAMTAGWFWACARLGEVFDRGGIDAVSKRINGGTNGLQERKDLFAQCLTGLG